MIIYPINQNKTMIQSSLPALADLELTQDFITTILGGLTLLFDVPVLNPGDAVTLAFGGSFTDIAAILSLVGWENNRGSLEITYTLDGPVLETVFVTTSEQITLMNSGSSFNLIITNRGKSSVSITANIATGTRYARPALPIAGSGGGDIGDDIVEATNRSYDRQDLTPYKMTPGVARIVGPNKG